ncbi:type II toxin-antitoxin system HipA family toxin YjjJ [Xanthomonas phaseoli]|uniref:type II toxin-antitoxin system HipA family toxin YjjJ n=2 Tax=Xanthomonas phaseoli TaxID=1985254 RepID=UPI00036E96E5|nr:type II toxin-antitoxin system HipA family toxin YjjJ [Xanthomonas phaseoli]MBO9756320.1 type II toxin-antitoxin system HipA family toxin YjjJ [Xanthomonas phaseoli pv. manihotis]MBO9762759.1 type II toxin-antitoxin system HipA family toxin YjjJ [Xanthomonas phaseoli pv. manihotis]MCC8535105.1 type II toxin-antitoxin system HipA family toxin YjjJ [Xanthomonas phaseoli]RWU19520.1 type II toxin-antitoxin system HipA family toxinoxin YjjJ [Xanthomonas phaseoli pv. manihotis str. CIO151]UEQ1564
MIYVPQPEAVERLVTTLRIDGPLRGADLAARLGVSKATLSRLVAAAGAAVRRYGSARATSYAAAGEVRGARAWPLYRIDSHARVVALGQLHALHHDHFFVELLQKNPVLLHPPMQLGVFESLPWFLDDQRPQGFLGRNLARRVSGPLRLPENLMLWSPSDTLVALLADGHDQLGDLLVGEHALARALSSIDQPECVDIEARTQTYLQHADAALRGEDVGSSAAGEQPKFTAVLREHGVYRPVIVKFSDRIDQPAGRRWADLLQMEHLANQVLLAGGIAAATTQRLQAGERVFLESTRFDRTPMLGRHGFVSLMAIFTAFYGQSEFSTWRTLAPLLKRDGWLSSEDAERLEVISWFGVLIGNTDMHLGNAALILADTLPLRLAPVYDMLPMALRPASSGEIVPREIETPPPTVGQFAQWRRAAEMAEQFWQRSIHDAALSDQMRGIATRALASLRRTASRLA